LAINLKQSFVDILNKYFRRNEKYLLSDNILYEMNGVVLMKTNHAIFDFHGLVVDDIIAYCAAQGHKPDRIIFVSSYDIEIEDAPTMNMKMHADSKISIIEEDGKIIARVCIGEWVALKEA